MDVTRPLSSDDITNIRCYAVFFALFVPTAIGLLEAAQWALKRRRPRPQGYIVSFEHDGVALASYSLDDATARRMLLNLERDRRNAASLTGGIGTRSLPSPSQDCFSGEVA
jgi:hypothetical protein